MANEKQTPSNVVEVRTAAQTHKMMQEKAELLSWLQKEQIKTLYYYEQIKSRR